MEQRVGFHVFLRHQRCLVILQHDIGHRGEDTVVFGAEHIGQDHLLGPLRLAHALVIGQVEGDGLRTRDIVAAAMDLIGHCNRAFEPALEILVRVGNGQVLFHRPQVVLVLRQRGAFFGIAQRHEAFEGGLGAVQPVGINLVGTDRDLDRRILQVHPRHLAGKIVVGQEAGRAQREKFLQAGVGRPLCRPFEQACGGHQPFAIFLRIGDGDEALAAALDHRIGAGQCLALVGIGREIGVEFRARQVLRIKACPFRHGLRPPEGVQLGDLVPRTEIAVEHRHQHVAVGAAAARDRLA